MKAAYVDQVGPPAAAEAHRMRENASFFGRVVLNP